MEQAISVGGKYVNLTQEYIIASASQMDEKTVFSQAFVLRLWLISCSPKLRQDRRILLTYMAIESF
jgi:hypothetical protein